MWAVAYHRKYVNFQTTTTTQRLCKNGSDVQRERNVQRSSSSSGWQSHATNATHRTTSQHRIGRSNLFVRTMPGKSIEIGRNTPIADQLLQQSTMRNYAKNETYRCRMDDGGKFPIPFRSFFDTKYFFFILIVICAHYAIVSYSFGLIQYLHEKKNSNLQSPTNSRLLPPYRSVFFCMFSLILSHVINFATKKKWVRHTRKMK